MMTSVTLNPQPGRRHSNWREKQLKSEESAAGVAIPGQMRVSLQAMKSAHKPVVIGLARMVQEQPATGPG